MKKNIIIPLSIIILVFIFLPTRAFAAFNGLKGLFFAANSLVGELYVLVAAAALFFFFWGVAKFVKAAGDEEAIKQGKSLMIWGIIALFVISALWGIISFIQTELNIDNSSDVPIELLKNL